VAIGDIEAVAAEHHDVGESPSRSGKDKKVTGKSPTRIAIGRLLHDPVAVVCGLVVLTLVVLAAIGPLINDWLQISGTPDGDYSLDANSADVLTFDGLPNEGYGPPLYGFTWKHPLGVEPGTANDNLARLLLGLRTSLLIASIATLLTTVVGVVLGLVAGFVGGWVDRGISFVTDVFLSFPYILGALALAPIVVSRWGQTDESLGRAQFWALIGILVILGWMGVARLVRGQVLSLREREFIQASRVIGAPLHRILFRELLPNLVAPIVIAVSLGLPAYVAAEAGLSYLGIGLTGQPSLGQTIAKAQGFYDLYPLYLFAPVAVVAVLVLSLNLLGDAVRDAFDPKTRR
jgi:ABC-type dipeptide/oligopeptide/nickel transport system permease subunit